MNISDKIKEELNKKTECPKCKAKIRIKNILKGKKCPECGFAILSDDLGIDIRNELKDIEKTISKLNITIDFD